MLMPMIRLFTVVALLITCSLPFPGNALAADNKSAEEAGPEKKQTQKLEQAFSDLISQRQTIHDMEQLAAASDGQLKEAFIKRLDSAWLEFLAQNLSYAETVAGEDKADPAMAPFRKKATQVLAGQAKIADTTIQRLRQRFALPAADQSVAEQATAYTRMGNVQAMMNQTLDLLVRSNKLARDFDLDVSVQETAAKKKLTEYAMKRSVLLDMAKVEAATLREGISVVPEDADLKAELAVTTRYVQLLADGLAPLLKLMDQLGMDSSIYQEQVLSATGEITSDVFEVGVITSLLVGWGQTLWEVIIVDGPDLIFKILLFFIIVYAARKLASVVQKVVESGLEKSQFQLSELLRRMVVSIVRNIIIILGVLIALSQVGFTLGPLLAGLGVVGFVIGFALQDSLANFASGLLILVYRPYDVGDLIDTAGVFGTVSHMSLVNTTIMTLDNQTIILPNNKIWGDVIKNVTAQTQRRVDMMFGISYSDDIPKAEQLLQGILESHDKILTDPAPMVRLHELGDSSVNFVVRPWVNRDDYWDVYWDVTRAVKMRFDEEAVSIPFPQRDVHIYNQNSPVNSTDQNPQVSQSSPENQDNPDSQDAE